MKKIFNENKIEVIALICELLVILICIPFLFTKNDIYTINSDEFTYGAGVLTENGVRLDNGVEGEISSKEIELPRGVYRVKVYYDTDADQKHSAKVVSYKSSYNALKTNAITLYKGLSNTDYLIYLSEKTDDIKVVVNYSGAGYINVKNVEFIETNVYVRELMFVFALLFAGTLLFLLLKTKGFFTKDRKVSIVFLAGCFLISCVPLMTDYMMTGSDYIYHLLRIEGVKDGILAGYFPVRIYPGWVYGYGYIDAVMYGNLLLYFPALLRLIGFPVTFSYKAFLVFINLLTVISSYVSFKKISGDKKAAIMGTYLYVLMPYRFSTLFNLAMAGVYCASIFYPIVLLGIYKIFTDDTDNPKYKHNWLIAVLGLCGVLWNHVLSTEIIGFIIIAFCIVFIKRTLKPKRFIQLLLSACVTLIASAWFIIPFLDNYMHQDLQIKNVFSRTIQERGIHPAQFFMLFISQDTAHTMYGQWGMQNALDLTFGFALTLTLFIFIAILILKKEESNKKYIKTGVVFSVTAVILSWMCTLFFPWDFLQSRVSFLKSLISGIQFPTRLIIFAGIFLIVVAMNVFLILKDKEKFANIFMGAMIALSIVSALYYSNELLKTVDPYKLYDVSEFGTGFTSGSEYIFNDIKNNYNEILTYRDPIASSNVQMSAFGRKGLDVIVECSNTSGENGFVDMPMLFYLGYSAEDINTGETMTCIFGDRCDIRTIIPSGYSGTFEVKYTGKGYWRLGDLVSAASLLGIAAYMFLSFRKKKPQAK